MLSARRLSDLELAVWIEWVKDRIEQAGLRGSWSPAERLWTTTAIPEVSVEFVFAARQRESGQHHALAGAVTNDIWEYCHARKITLGVYVTPQSILFYFPCEASSYVSA